MNEMTASVLVLLGLLLGIGLVLVLLARRFRPDEGSVVEQINSILPQTQCGQCNFPGCRPYAEAIADGRADINQCPPGGEAGVQALADLLGREPKPLDESHGVHKPPMVALIDEQRCIGCKLCIQACPVDAILGAAKLMHTVIADECTGCELCLPPCPVDCIEMLPRQRPFVWPLQFDNGALAVEPESLRRPEQRHA